MHSLNRNEYLLLNFVVPKLRSLILLVKEKVAPLVKFFAPGTPISAKKYRSDLSYQTAKKYSAKKPNATSSIKVVTKNSRPLRFTST